MIITREVNGIPLWLMREYLEELGGKAKGDHEVAAADWDARIYKVEDFKLGSISIGRVRLELTGEDSVIETLLPRLELKLLRGGG